MKKIIFVCIVIAVLITGIFITLRAIIEDNSGDYYKNARFVSGRSFETHIPVLQ